MVNKKIISPSSPLPPPPLLSLFLLFLSSFFTQKTSLTLNSFSFPFPFLTNKHKHNLTILLLYINNKQLQFSLFLWLSFFSRSLLYSSLLSVAFDSRFGGRRPRSKFKVGGVHCCYCSFPSFHLRSSCVKK